MGMYINPGKQRFMKALNSSIYIDKTEMIIYLNSLVNTEQMYVSVSRPRRFGKSMAANMICAYYGTDANSNALFETTKLSKHEGWDKYLGEFDVIRIVMTDFIRQDCSVGDSIALLCRRILDELDDLYPGTKYDSSDFIFSMGKFYQKSKRQFVIVIDEWDAVFRERKEDKAGQEKYLDFLRDWLKDKDYVALAYMTGILPIKKYGKHSALNMFTEYSMTAPMQMARYTGFTEEEVILLCKQYGRDFDKIKEWYDGYIVNDIIPPDPDRRIQKETGEPPKPDSYSLYSPLSVVSAVSSGQIRNYWNKTENYEALAEYIRMDYDGLQSAVALLMGGGRIRPDLRRYQNDMTTFHSRDDILALLIHLGYLGFEEDTGEVFIPNREILDEFKASTDTVNYKKEADSGSSDFKHHTCVIEKV